MKGKYALIYDEKLKIKCLYVLIGNYWVSILSGKMKGIII